MYRFYCPDADFACPKVSITDPDEIHHICHVLGLKEGGVDYAMDEHNAKLVSADMKKKVEAAKADIISGKIKVADYMADNACKY